MATTLLSLPDELLLSTYSQAFFTNTQPTALPQRYQNEVALAPTARLRSIAKNAFYDSFTLNLTINVSTTLQGPFKSGLKQVQSSYIQVTNIPGTTTTLSTSQLERCGALRGAKKLRVLLMCGPEQDRTKAVEILKQVIQFAERARRIEVLLWTREGEEDVMSRVEALGGRRLQLVVKGREETRDALFGGGEWSCDKTGDLNTECRS